MTTEEEMIEAIIADRSQARGAADKWLHGTLGAIANGDIAAIDTLRGSLSRDLGESREDVAQEVEPGGTYTANGATIPELTSKADEQTT